MKLGCPSWSPEVSLRSAGLRVSGSRRRFLFSGLFLSFSVVFRFSSGFSRSAVGGRVSLVSSRRVGFSGGFCHRRQGWCRHFWSPATVPAAGVSPDFSSSLSSATETAVLRGGLRFSCAASGEWFSDIFFLLLWQCLRWGFSVAAVSCFPSPPVVPPPVFLPPTISPVTGGSPDFCRRAVFCSI